MTPLLAHLSHSLYWNNWESNYKCKPFIKLTVKPDVLVLVIKCYFFWDANLLCYLYILTKNTTCTKKQPGLDGRLANQKAYWGGVGHFLRSQLICFCHFVKIHQNPLFGWSITKELPMCTGTLLLVSGWPRAIYPTHPPPLPQKDNFVSLVYPQKVWRASLSVTKVPTHPSHRFISHNHDYLPVLLERQYLEMMYGDDSF